MPSKQVKPYCGASSRIAIDDLVKLGPAYMIQPKIDGAYCHVHLNPVGCIARISSRTGRDYTGSQVDGLLGAFVGYPNAVMAGELEAHTESGVKAAKEFGQARIHLFDLLWGYDAAPVHRLPYHERRAELFRMQTRIEELSGGQSWRRSEHGVRDRKTGWFTKPTLSGIALTPIVPQVAPGAAAELWDMVKAGKLEGLVAVALGAPAGRRGAKRKCKNTTTIDAVVLGADNRTVEALFLGKVFYLHRGKRNCAPGDLVEVAHDGWYGDGTPKFGRILRVRHDLAGAAL